MTIQASTSFGDIPTITEFDVTSVSPTSLAQGAAGNVTIRGVGFGQGTSFSFGNGVTVSNLNIASATQATARLTVAASATVGNRDVKGTQGGTGGLTATLTNGFKVTAAPPSGFTITDVSPVSAPQGTSLDVTVTGTGFTAGTSFAFGSGITVGTITRNSTTSARVQLSIAANANLGGRTVTGAQGGSNQTASLGNGFRVTAAPDGGFSIAAVSPASAAQGVAREVTVTGTGFAAGTSFSFGQGIAVTRVVRSSTTSAKVSIVVAGTAVVGRRDVTGAQGGSSRIATLTNGFQVTAGPVANVSSPQMRLAAGLAHACAVDAAGQARCWGDGTHGQLGDTRLPGSASPGTVDGPRLVSLYASRGGNHSCGLTAAGAAWCWGRNDKGQLGNGTTTDRTAPVQVSGLDSGVASLALGSQHSCALMKNGSVKCWGDGANGRLGTGSNAARLVPADVSGPAVSATAVGAGAAHTCVVTQDRKLQCWGRNDQSQLGDGSQTDRSRPVESSLGTARVVDLALGDEHSCALKTTGEVLCWGRGNDGRLGTGTAARRSIPTLVTGLPGIASQVASGGAHSCALMQGGGLQCWGKNNASQLGVSSPATRSTPAAVANIEGVIQQVALGSDFSCVMTVGNEVRCWGNGRDGRLGRGTGANIGTATAKRVISGLPSTVYRASASADFGCAATVSGAAYCWGVNGYGQLGDGMKFTNGTHIDSSGPRRVEVLGTRVAEVGTGAEHACALLIDGSVWCWGRNNFGQIGRAAGGQQDTPVRVGNLAASKAVTTGDNHSCALTQAGGVRCWGNNAAGQLGDGTRTNRSAPVSVSGLSSGVAAISAGSRHTCALLTNGKIKCWGNNDSRQLGDNTATSRTVPVDLADSDTWRAISAGRDHTCGITTAGRGRCWGSAADGRLGNGSRSGSFGTPQTVSGLTSGVSEIVAGRGYHSCAIHGGAVKCWGENLNGQLGSRTVSDSASPMTVSGVSGSHVGLTLGERNSCVRVTGVYQCWGYGGIGATGSGGDLPAHAPMPISRFTLNEGLGTRLSNNEPIEGLSGLAGQWREFVISVPPGASNLVIETSGGSGSIHIFVQRNGLPTPASNLCARQTGGTAKSCTIANPQPGDYLITLRGETDYSGVILRSRYTARVGESVPVSGLAGIEGTMLSFSIQVPAGMRNLRVAIGGGSGDVDLYVRRGAFATLERFDCAATGLGSDKACEFANPASGLWYVLVYGRTDFVDVSMVAGYNDGSGAYVLTMRKAGTGSGSIKTDTGSFGCGPSNWPCSVALAAGSGIILKPTAAAGSSFIGWQGCTAVSGNDCVVVANRAYSVTASFQTQTRSASLRFDSASGPTSKSVVRHSGTPVRLAWTTSGLASGATCRIYRRADSAYGAAASPVASGNFTDDTMHTWAVGQHKLYLRCSDNTTSPDITLTVQSDLPGGTPTARLRFNSANGPTSSSIRRNSGASVTFAWATTNLPSGATCRIYRLPDDSYKALASPVAGGTRVDTSIHTWATGQRAFYLRCSDGTMSPDITLSITN